MGGMPCRDGEAHGAGTADDAHHAPRHVGLHDTLGRLEDKRKQTTLSLTSIRSNILFISSTKSKGHSNDCQIRINLSLRGRVLGAPVREAGGGGARCDDASYLRVLGGLLLRRAVLGGVVDLQTTGSPA